MRFSDLPHWLQMSIAMVLGLAFAAAVSYWTVRSMLFMIGLA